MDIRKEKIAHEKHLISQGVDFKYLPNIQYNELENVYELIELGEEYSEALNEINSSWCTWQAAKAQAVQAEFEIGQLKDRITELLDERQDLYAQIEAQAVPEGFVLVPVKEIKKWYLDDSESIYREDPYWLCDISIGEVVEVEHRVSYELDQDPVFAAIQWDEENGDVGYYETFKTKAEAEKVAAHCKAMVEAQEPAND